MIDQLSRNLKHGEDGNDKIYGKLVLFPDISKKLAVKLDVNKTKSDRCGKELSYYADNKTC